MIGEDEGKIEIERGRGIVGIIPTRVYGREGEKLK